MARRKTHTESWWEANTNPAILRCTARYKSNGERCRSEALDGTTVCYKHGGAAPQVVAKAAVRIQMTADAAAAYMRGVLEDPNVSDREKIVAAKDILDRAGLGGTQKHLVGVAQLDPVEQLFQDILSTPGALADPSAVQVRALPASDPAQEAVDAAEREFFTDDGDDDLLGEPDIVDAEVVEERSPAKVEAERAASRRRSSGTPKHIREAEEMAEELRRLL